MLPIKVCQLLDNGRIALRVHLAAYNAKLKRISVEAETYRFVLHQILPKALALATDPAQWQPHRQTQVGGEQPVLL